ncbi:MAG: YhdP family protein [Woeseiaceae bacterium]
MFRKLFKILAYAAATLVVLLAIALGLLRIALPQLPEYRDEIQARIAETIDGDVRFESLDARWRFLGPEIVFKNFVIGPEIGGQSIEPIVIESLRVGVSVSDLLLERKLVIRRIGVSGVRLGVFRDEAGWRVQALALTLKDPDVEKPTNDRLSELSPLDISIEEVTVSYMDATADGKPLLLEIVSAGMALARGNVRFDAELRQPDVRDANADLLLSGKVDGFRVEQIIDGDWVASAELDAVSAELMRSLLPRDWQLPTAGVGNAVADVHWSDGGLRSVAVTLDADELVPAGGSSQAAVSGRAEWTRRDDGWLCAIDDFVVGVSDRQWPAASLKLQSDQTDSLDRIGFDASNVTVYDMPYLAAFLPPALADDLRATELAGTIIKASGFIELMRETAEDATAWSRLTDYDLNAEFDGLSVAPIDGLPGFSNLSGDLRVKPSAGSLNFKTVDGSLTYEKLFSSAVPIQRLDGTIVWRRSDKGFTVLSDSIRMQNQPLSQDIGLELFIPADDSGLVVDLSSRWSIDDLAKVSPLLPNKVMSEKLVAWLRESLLAGRIEDGRFRLSGNMKAFPFESGDGEFSASGSTRDATLRYAKTWPEVTSLDAEVALNGWRLSTNENKGRSGGIAFEDSKVAFADLRSGILSIETAGRAPLPDIYTYSSRSPIRNLFGNAFDLIEVDGNASYQIDLTVPLKALKTFTLDANLKTEDGQFGLSNLPFATTGISGTVRLDRKGVYADNVEAVAFERAVLLDMGPAEADSGYGLKLDVRGVMPSTAMVEDLKIPLQGKLDGEAPYTARIWLPKTSPDAVAQPIKIDWQSSLEGLAIGLPYPVGKLAEASSPTEVSLIVENGLSFDITRQSGVSFVAIMNSNEDGGLSFDRGTVHLGVGKALLPVVPGLFVDGKVDWIRVDDWLDSGSEGSSGITELLQSISLDTETLFAFGQQIESATTTLQATDNQWLINVNAPEVAGNIIVPRQLDNPEATVTLDMERLNLLESDPESGGDADPTALPALAIRARSFALAEKKFGALTADVAKVDNGVRITRLETTASAFSIAASGDWLLDPVEVSGSRTRLNARIVSEDVKAMMDSLGYQPGINANELLSEVELSWGGGPGADFLAGLDGSAKVTISNGTLDDVEPGAGRVVGLMSVAELPRRLALDFRDVFRKGFSFDLIEGDFRIVNGDAYTCNLNLQGSSADVGLIGRASLDRRNYNQTAVVSVKVGNTLPAVGAVVAGPQVGAALLIFSQIFKKPLQGMTEVFYQINGGWDEPSIDRTDSARFAATAELAGCLVNTGN